MKESVRLLRAFAWLRWRLAINSLRKGRRKGGLEAVSAAMSVAVPILLGILIIPLLLGIAVASVIGGWGIAARGGVWTAIASVALRFHFGIGLAALLVGPLVRSARGGGGEYSRYALLPVPRRLLHAIEMVSALTDPFILAAMPPLVLLPLGYLAGGGSVPGAAVALFAGVAMAALLACLASLAQFLFHLVFRSRRRAEAVFLVMVVGFSCFGLLGSVLDRNRVDRHRREAAARSEARSGSKEKGPAGSADSTPEGDRDASSAGEATAPADAREPKTFPDFTPRGWSLLVPSELYASTTLDALAGHLAPAAAKAAALAIAAVTFYVLSLRGWRRLLETPATGSGRRGSNRFRGLPVLGFLPGGPPVAAVAAASVRAVLRTITGKMAVFFAPLFGLLCWIAFFQLRHAPAFVTPLAGGIITAIAGLMAILSLQPVLLNQFAADRAGLALAFLSPLSDRQIIRGKLFGAGLLVLLSATFGILPAVAIAPRTHPLLYPAGVLLALSAYALAGPAAAILSTLLPVTMDLGKIGRGARPHQGAAMLFFPVVSASAGPGVLLAAYGLLGLHSPLATLGLLAGWLAAAEKKGGQAPIKIMGDCPRVFLTGRLCGLRERRACGRGHPAARRRRS